MKRSCTALLLLLTACGSSSGSSNTTPAKHAEQRPIASTNTGDALREPLSIKDVGFRTPESVLHDTRADIYLVSNIDGSPLDEDDRAFISRVRPDGRVEQLKWIDAAQPGVTLDAPKGMALVGDVLYVADITFVRKFDRTTGKPLGSIKLPEATFVNDLSSDQAGFIYASDSGITHGFRLSGSDAVYKIGSGDQVSVLAKSPSLGRPNGLSSGADGLWVATFGSGELYQLSATGQRTQTMQLPKGSLDGVTRLGERLFVSSWEASAVYERDGDQFVERISDLPAPSDIGIDQRRSRLLVPLFYDNTVIVFQL